MSHMTSESSAFFTNKDDDDPILEFKSIDTGHLEVKKVYLGGIPFLPATAPEFLAHSLHRLEELRELHRPPHSGVVGPQMVLPFDPYRYTWVRTRKKFFALARSAFINLPDGAGMRWIAHMEECELPELVTTIGYTMNLIRLAQAKGYTVFIVGTRDEVLDKLVVNLRRSFPNLRIVGKHHGYLKGESQRRVVEALRKTDPHIILLGLGYHKGMKWLMEHKGEIGNCIIVNMAGQLDILAGRHKKAPDWFVTHGYTWLWRSMNRPWRWHRFFVIIYWFFTSVFRRLFHKNKKASSIQTLK